MKLGPELYKCWKIVLDVMGHVRWKKIKIKLNFGGGGGRKFLTRFCSKSAFIHLIMWTLVEALLERILGTYLLCSGQKWKVETITAFWEVFHIYFSSSSHKKQATYKNTLKISYWSDEWIALLWRRKKIGKILSHKISKLNSSCCKTQY